MVLRCCRSRQEILILMTLMPTRQRRDIDACGADRHAARATKIGDCLVVTGLVSGAAHQNVNVDLIFARVAHPLRFFEVNLFQNASALRAVGATQTPATAALMARFDEWHKGTLTRRTHVGNIRRLQLSICVRLGNLGLLMAQLGDPAHVLLTAIHARRIHNTHMKVHENRRHQIKQGRRDGGIKYTNAPFIAKASCSVTFFA